MQLSEGQSRELAANIVAAMHVRSHGLFKVVKVNVAIVPGGLRFQLQLADTGLVVEQVVPPGHFAYDRLADEFIRCITTSTMDTKGDS
jgi:hypothetical protein